MSMSVSKILFMYVWNSLYAHMNANEWIRCSSIIRSTHVPSALCSRFFFFFSFFQCLQNSIVGSSEVKVNNVRLKWTTIKEIRRKQKSKLKRYDSWNWFSNAQNIRAHKRVNSTTEYKSEHFNGNLNASCIWCARPPVCEICWKFSIIFRFGFSFMCFSFHSFFFVWPDRHSNSSSPFIFSHSFKDMFRQGDKKAYIPLFPYSCSDRFYF